MYLLLPGGYVLTTYQEGMYLQLTRRVCTYNLPGGHVLTTYQEDITTYQEGMWAFATLSADPYLAPRVAAEPGVVELLTL